MNESKPTMCAMKCNKMNRHMKIHFIRHRVSLLYWAGCGPRADPSSSYHCKSHWKECINNNNCQRTIIHMLSKILILRLYNSTVIDLIQAAGYPLCAPPSNALKLHTTTHTWTFFPLAMVTPLSASFSIKSHRWSFRRRLMSVYVCGKLVAEHQTRPMASATTLRELSGWEMCKKQSLHTIHPAAWHRVTLPNAMLWIAFQVGVKCGALCERLKPTWSWGWW